MKITVTLNDKAWDAAIDALRRAWVTGNNDRVSDRLFVVKNEIERQVRKGKKL